MPYDEGDADFFFGRSGEVAIVAANLRTARLTVLYGPSGVGKSSLLLAGVVGELRAEAAAEGAFAVCVFRAWREEPLAGVQAAARAVLQEQAGGVLPGPAGSLAESFRAWTAQAGTLLLVFDQFEEYFQYHPGEQEGERLSGFAAELARVVNDPGLQVNVLLSIREDAWASLDRFEGHIPSLFANYLRVDHLDLQAAREAIEGPIAAFNDTLPDGEEPYRIEPALVEAVLAATAGGTLTLGGESQQTAVTAADRVEAPFLQLVCERLWRATLDAGEHTLTLARLQALGGAARIVENHLLEALGRLTPEEQDSAAGCFRFLVSRGNTKIAHTATDLADWTGQPEPQLTAVLEKLCSGESGRILRAIAPTQTDPSPSYELFHDILAQPILDWRKQHEHQRAQEAEAQRQQAARRKLLLIAATLLTLTLTFAAFAAWALHEQSTAKKRTKIADSQALAAGALERLGTHPAAALGLAVRAVEKRQQTPEARRALRAALVNSRVRFVLPVGRRNASSPVPVDAAFSPDGGLLLTTGADGVARLWRTATGRQAAALRVPGHRVLDAAFGPRGMFVVTTSDDSTARLWKTSTGKEVASLRVPRARLLAATFGARGPVVLTVAPHRPPALRNLRTPGRVVVLAGQREPPARAVFSPDGRLLLTFGGSGPARVFATESGRQLAAPRTFPSEASFSRDGRFLVTVGERARVWSTTSWRPVAELGQAAHAVLSAPGGRRVLTVDRDGTAKIWDRATGTPLAVLPGSGSPPSGTYTSTFSPTGAFSTDGRLVATTGWDGTVRVWETASAKPLASLAAGYANRVAFSPTGRLLASATWDGTVAVSQTVPSVTIATGFGPPTSDLCCRGFEPVLSPKGNLVVAATKDGAAVWRLDGTKAGRLPQPNDTVVSSAAFSADGRSIATSTLLNVARTPLPPLPTTVWRTRDFTRVAVVPGQASTVVLSPDGRIVVIDGTARSVSSRARIPALRGTVAFDAAGRRAVVAGGRAGVRIVSSPDGGPISTLQGGARSLDTAAFSPDGQRLVGGASQGRLRLWDPATGRLVAPLGRSDESSKARFSADSKLVLASTSNRLSVWRASDGKRVETRPTQGRASFSPDGLFAAIPEDGGKLAVVDLASGVTTELQTATAAKLANAAFDPGSQLLVAWDVNGNVQVVACEICAAQRTLLALAHDRLAHTAGFRRRAPGIALLGVG